MLDKHRRKDNIMKNIKKTLLVLLTFVLTLGGVISASAATVSIKMLLEDQPMKTIKKTGTYKLNNRTNQKQGFVKFKAPKTGTYEFTFKNVSYDGEKDDLYELDYYNWDNFDYNREIEVAMQYKDSYWKEWRNIRFNGRESFELVSLRRALHLVDYGGYDASSLKEIFEKYENGEISNEEVSDYLIGHNVTTDVALKVKMKKDTVIRIRTTGDLKKSYCILNIKKK